MGGGQRYTYDQGQAEQQGSGSVDGIAGMAMCERAWESTGQARSRRLL